MRRICCSLLILGLVGCSDAKKNPVGNAMAPQAKGQLAQEPRPANAAGGPMAPGAAGEPPAVEKPVTRKIVYTSTVDLVVADFAQIRDQISQLAEQFGGFVGNSRMDATAGDRRRATWTLRIPVAKHRAALSALEQLGHIVSISSDSQDVTDEFYDLEARVKTKQEEEKALREILAKSAVKLEDIMTMRRELTRIREEIEAAQGRINKLSKLSDLATITLTVHEQKDYVPPTTPTFGARISDTFSESADALWNMLKAIVVGLAALTPWLPILLVVAGIGYLVVRWQARAGLARSQTTSLSAGNSADVPTHPLETNPFD